MSRHDSLGGLKIASQVSVLYCSSLGGLTVTGAEVRSRSVAVQWRPLGHYYSPNQGIKGLQGGKRTGKKREKDMKGEREREAGRVRIRGERKEV